MCCLFLFFVHQVFVGDALNFLATFSLFYLYGLAVLPLSYCYSWIFENHASAQIGIAALHFLTGESTLFWGLLPFSLSLCLHSFALAFSLSSFCSLFPLSFVSILSLLFSNSRSSSPILLTILCALLSPLLIGRQLFPCTHGEDGDRLPAGIDSFFLSLFLYLSLAFSLLFLLSAFSFSLFVACFLVFLRSTRFLLHCGLPLG